MKKLKLNLSADKTSALTREQLKYIMGGELDDGSCQLLGSECRASLNCCNYLTCDATYHHCKEF